MQNRLALIVLTVLLTVAGGACGGEDLRFPGAATRTPLPTSTATPTPTPTA